MPIKTLADLANLIAQHQLTLSVYSSRRYGFGVRLRTTDGAIVSDERHFSLLLAVHHAFIVAEVKLPRPAVQAVPIRYVG